MNDDELAELLARKGSVSTYQDSGDGCIGGLGNLLLCILAAVCILVALILSSCDSDPYKGKPGYWSADCGGYTSVCRKTGEPAPTPAPECIGFIGCE